MSNLYRVFIVWVPLSLLLSACRSDRTVSSERTRIAVSIEPQRYFVENLADTLFDVHCIVPSGQSPETYDPTPTDMVGLADCRAYLYVGGLGFEMANIERIASTHSKLKLFDLSKALDSDAVCVDKEPDQAHNHDHHCAGDPHYWLSCVGAKAMTIATADALIDIDGIHTEVFEQRKEQMLRMIDSVAVVLDARLDAAGRPAFVIYHPSLSYYAEEFGLRQLVIEQNGKEPSPAHLARLIDEAKRLGVRTVFVQREFSRTGAEQVARALGARLVEIAPLNQDWQTEIGLITDELCHYQ